mmetsp:Transcript_109656/g.318644  ORF Transcript_109656/g.318644 Transcript_109656/m.318644 type:complete len:226 (-) Transcript_109656:1600-2277(-)
MRPRLRGCTHSERASATHRANSSTGSFCATAVESRWTKRQRCGGTLQRRTSSTKKQPTTPRSSFSQASVRIRPRLLNTCSRPPEEGCRPRSAAMRACSRPGEESSSMEWQRSAGTSLRAPSRLTTAWRVSTTRATPTWPNQRSMRSSGSYARPITTGPRPLTRSTRWHVSWTIRTASKKASNTTRVRRPMATEGRRRRCSTISPTPTERPLLCRWRLRQRPFRRR